MGGKWDIQLDGVRAALGHTGEVAGKFEEEFTSYGEHVSGAATSAGTMALGGATAPEGGFVGPVGAALKEFADGTENDLRFLPVRAGKSIKGAREAAEAYQQGDLEMAQNKEDAALKAPTPEELKPPKDAKK
ncbi:hypothetical protein BLA24_20720 [Streptomyces cinnamoneus]|uniref:ESX-1 secretion-associated protein n=1 Tax=Streptomyces cinnamoneus TaxID=53446 RepID=A0A2G1XFL9_STRCJ|nr:DUF6507 family protein [Streptomyces cinnamoneus]PHQ50036.1 hypothetical protein BLA24_20720 [Streptomyces cinnamoneus]PPT13186.1 hypothetical protein CYQ11_10060 [Streptomyces cinnamoneus]